MIVWLAALIVSLGVALAVWALKPDPQMVAVGVDPEDVVPTSRAMELERSAAERIFEPTAAAISKVVNRFMPSGVLDATAHTLRVADLDKRWRPEIIVGMQVAGFVFGVAFSAYYLSSSGSTRTNLMVCGLVVALFTMGPNAKIKRMADDRRKAITNELPDVLDQLKVTVEAGMSFDGALLRAGQEGRGVLTTELLKAVNDMQLGLSRGEALQAVADRTDVPDLRQFVTAVRQAEKHGFPLANILKLQALELRDRRRARAEERAMQVPVKITFPLVFCILPALFIVILGPAAVSVSQGF
ncbi:type II secretion system F family protein [Actinospongicola halichondriae]|uniref:type II secretion system F family protein n=1 Tax=Actinospongicola halichondriae TaxID=3236844 RepID=UPI003D55D81A